MTVAFPTERLFFGICALGCGALTVGAARAFSALTTGLGNESQKHNNQCEEKLWLVAARICVIVVGSSVVAIGLAATGYAGIFALTGKFISVSPTLIGTAKITIFSITGFCTLAGTLIVCFKPPAHEPGNCPLPPGVRRTGIQTLHSQAQPPVSEPKPVQSARMPGRGRVLGTGKPA